MMSKGHEPQRNDELQAQTNDEQNDGAQGETKGTDNGYDDNMRGQIMELTKDDNQMTRCGDKAMELTKKRQPNDTVRCQNDN